MASDAKASCVVFGAGALGLGFLGPELSPRCRITYLDIPAKGGLLAHLRQTGGYVFNETGLSMRPVTVTGVGGLCLGEADAEEVQGVLDAADFVVTAVGGPSLPGLASTLAGAAARRDPDRPLRILCGENGLEIARNVRAAVEKAAGCEFGDRLRVGDTVMGRMCKVVTGPFAAGGTIRPPAPGLGWAVVAEPFFGIPVQEHAVAGLPNLPSAIEPQGPDRFGASEDVKMLAHNGPHAVLACLGHLRGARHFSRLRDDAELMEMARRLLVDEAGAALLKKHRPVLGRNEFFNYC
ncbi:unnamed protein product, partial [marine sediment metagenome]